jgi:hypothetical protein
MGQSIREQVKGLDIKVENNVPPKEYSRFDDFTFVLDLRPKHCVLFIGSNVYYPTVQRHVDSITTIRKKGEIDRFVERGETFDRVFITRENVLDQRLVESAVTLAGADGLVVFFSEEETLRAEFSKMVQVTWPLANVWDFKSNVGPMVVTDAHGVPRFRE